MVLQDRGLKDIFIAYVDSLKVFYDAINVVYPKMKIQLCFVYLVCNSLKVVFQEDYKTVTEDLKLIYQAPSEAQARENMTALSQKWQEKIPTGGKKLGGELGEYYHTFLITRQIFEKQFILRMRWNR